MFGPRSAGSTLVVLLREATKMLSDGPARVRGGPGALTMGMAEGGACGGCKDETGVLRSSGSSSKAAA